jgi:mono/diheme cytochrome c family protein
MRATDAYDSMPYQTTHNTGGTIMGTNSVQQRGQPLPAELGRAEPLRHGRGRVPAERRLQSDGDGRRPHLLGRRGHSQPVPAQPRTPGAGMRAFLLATAALAALSTAGLAQTTTYSQVERGRYIAATGNCQGCHTVPGEAPYSGGRPMPTPFGTIHAPNITFAERSGIGRWTKDDFWQAVHRGIARDGSAPLSRLPLSALHEDAARRRRCGLRLSRDAAAGAKGIAARTRIAVSAVSWRTSLMGWNLDVLHSGPVYEPDSCQGRRCLEPRRLSCRGPRPLRRLPHGQEPGRCEPTKRASISRAASSTTGRRPTSAAAGNGGISKTGADADIVEFLKSGRNAHTAAFSTMAEVIELFDPVDDRAGPAAPSPST